MRPRNTCALSAIAAVCLAATSAAFASPGEASVKKAMMANFDKSVKQFKAKDLKGFMSMYTDDFSGKGPDGRAMTKATIETEMKEAMATTKSVDESNLTIKKLTVKGDSADLESTMTLKMHVVDAKGEMGEKGKLHSLTMIEKSKETWVKTKDGWKVKKGEVLPGGKMLVDGKPFPPAPPAKKK